MLGIDNYANVGESRTEENNNQVVTRFGKLDCSDFLFYAQIVEHI
jgi:hypothetical protein